MIEKMGTLYPEMRLGQLLCITLSAFPVPENSELRAYKASDLELVHSFSRWHDITDKSSGDASKTNKCRQELLEKVRIYSELKPGWTIGRILALFSGWAGTSRPWFLINTDDEIFLQGACNPQEYEIKPDPLEWPAYADD
ncbi:MAG: hypothetical protein R3C11_28315 [Planctomycetaceae bacterium]